MPTPTRPSPSPAATQGGITPTPAGEKVGYRHAGVLTAEQVINGDANRFAWLDGKVLEVTAWVQQALVADNRSEDIEKARTDPHVRREISEEIDRLALQYLLRERGIRGEEGQVLIATVVNDIVGLGPLEPLWQDPSITEVIVNGPTDVYVERHGRLVKAKACRFRSQNHLLDVCQRILVPLNRKVDVRDPLADGRLPDGSRVNVVHQALAPKGPLLTIRRFPEQNRSLVDLVEIGSLNEQMATTIAGLIANRASCLVVGGTGSGKALDVSTPIPTPDGFVAMGDLRVGDTVFDERGVPTTVIGAYDFEYDRPCYEVTFSDGATIVADGSHLWLTDTRASRRAVSREDRASRVRATAIPREELAALVSLVDALPSDAAVTVAEMNRSLGWTDSRTMTRLYSVASGMVPLEVTRRGKLFLAHDLLNRAIDRFSRPWHDQRDSSEVPAVRSTEQIRDSLLTPSGNRNHSVSTAGVAQYPEQHLPVDPYVLGVWLGDGDKNSGRWYGIDQEIADRVAAAGYVVTSSVDPREGKHPDYRSWRAHGLQTELRALGVLRNKHIPHVYLYSSEKQRRDLLAGLLDTDGSANKQGGVEFYNTDYGLARAVYTLVASLGYKVTFREKKVGEEGNLHYTVAFRGNGGEFHLSRKNAIIAAARTTRGGTQQRKQHRRYIVSVEPVATRPVRCIRVANESHLFLAGESYIPTHNTTLLNALSAAIPSRERVVTIEDSLELRLNPTSHVAAMEARPPDSTGSNSISIRQLVKNALRMRPDRIIVGEIRDSAALDMLQACNTGHEGSMSTVHANGPNEAISRLTVMVAQGGEIPADKVEWLIGSAIDVIVMVRRYEDGSRRVSGIYEVPDISSLNAGEPLRTIPLWEWQQTGTGEDGMLVGEYVQRNEISDHLRRSRGLDMSSEVTWEDVQRMCGVETADTSVVKPTRPAVSAGGE